MTSALTFVSLPEPCLYLPDRFAQLRYQLDAHLTPTAYMSRLHEGWRRFGPIAFRPECASCAACQSLRVPVEAFRPSESQRRAWRKNAGDVEIRIGEPVETADRLDLLARFHQLGHATKGWPVDEEPDLGIFVSNPFPTEEWAYYLAGTLVGVGYVDVLPEGLSAIYFYWDPEQRRRSLGTFNVLALIAAARERALPHLYLGYYVEGCRSLEYKRTFRPYEILRDGAWGRAAQT